MTVTDCPSSTGFGEADRFTVGVVGVASSSRIVTWTDNGLGGSTLLWDSPSATVKVSSSSSSSCAVVMVPSPVSSPLAMVMLASDP